MNRKFKIVYLSIQKPPPPLVYKGSWPISVAKDIAHNVFLKEPKNKKIKFSIKDIISGKEYHYESSKIKKPTIQNKDNFDVHVVRIKKSKTNNTYEKTKYVKYTKRGGVPAISKFEFDSEVETLTLKECQAIESCNKNTLLINHPVLMTEKDRFEKFYTRDIRYTTFDGVNIKFNQNIYNKVFGPNIDTILFCFAVKKLLPEFNQQIKSFIEIGVGSGFIAKYIATKIENLTDIKLIDIEEQSINFSKDELELPSTKKNTWESQRIDDFQTYKQGKYTLYLGDALTYIKNILDKKYVKLDLIVCNPPYIPKSIEKETVDPSDQSIAKNFFEGTYLMRYIIRNLDNISNKTVMMIISSTSFCVEYVINEMNKLNQEWDFNIIVEREVPLKVYDDKGTYISDNQEWIKFLENNSGSISIKNKNFKKGVIKTDDSVYPYNHIVYVVNFFKK